MKINYCLILIFQVNLFAENTMLFTGKIENASTDSIRIYNHHRTVVQAIPLDEQQSFENKFEINPGFYTLKIGEEYTQLYLEPGYDLKLIMDVKKFDESVKYEGRGAAENNYLAGKIRLEAEFGQLDNYGYYGMLDEKQFLHLADSLHQVKMKYLEEFEPKFSEKFDQIAAKALVLEKVNKLANFEAIKHYLTKSPEFKVSSNFPDPFEGIDMNDEALVGVPNYLQIVEHYLIEKTALKLGENDDKDEVLMFVNVLSEEITNHVVKEELAFMVGKRSMSNSKQLEQVYAALQPLLQNQNYKEQVQTVYEKLKKTQKGNASPGFEFEDINGELVSLESLKGHVVYIDIWATWCKPCLRELPDLAKLQEDLAGKPIKFVSIGFRDKKESWKKMVTKKEMDGIHLFAPDKSSEFVKAYDIQSIPRFIMLDKEGNIIDANAKRPSNPELKAELESYL